MFPFDCYVYKVLSRLFMTLIIFTKRPAEAAAEEATSKRPRVNLINKFSLKKD